MDAALLPREFFEGPVDEIAPALLGHVLRHRTPDGDVAVRLTEVEAYAGPLDPASHAYRGRTPRNEVMFGPPGHAYVYFTYGMHFCVNLVCGLAGTSSAVLVRAGEIIAGEETARARRPRSTVRDLARGPARLCEALGIARGQNGLDVCAPGGELTVRAGEPADAARIRQGPRTGVNAAKDVPWRFWIDGDPSVSPYRAHAPRNRKAPASR
ncbi:DNA-3-methyladenine glycosylase [Actinomadura sp. WMMB 499]|uniref:DNA-3-methyladenine glycosylase n=1 Tax=Actinomadura sp. WMMB 499 TaxID=1219491 RepID=UPI0012440FDD|nr:DNA-3-methyladenine glycosylase [Actinomadura sp. WMMB 499]QFG26474.1 DNA-3-methyladenine glycosylase [Actinomadura sp. WMMB 499]